MSSTAGIGGDGINGQAVTPRMALSGHVSVAASSSGAAFPSARCKQLTISNDSGANIGIIQSGSGPALTIFPNTYFTLFGISNASEVSVKGSGTIVARWEG